MENNVIKLRRTTITVTLRCTLKCKYCSADVINYDNPPHYDCNFIARELREYFKIVDYVTWLQYSGGEPLMNKELPQMVEEAMKYQDKFDKLMIFTNGTLLPSEDMLKVFRKYKDKIQFFFSNYGSISFLADKLIKCFEDNGIAFEEKKYYGDDMHCGGWVDFGGWENRGCSDETLTKAYEKCSMHTMGFTVVQEGQMHLCRKSYRGMELGAVEKKTSDYIDILDEHMSVEEKKDKVRQMMKLPYLQACNHCNATYGDDRKEVRIIPAEQKGEK